MQAHKLAHQLPQTLDALAAGLINPEHARAAAEACYGLDQQTCAKVEQDVLETAAERNLTQFTRSVTRAIHRADPAGAEARHKQANKQDKGVWLRPLPDDIIVPTSYHPSARLRDRIVARDHTWRMPGCSARADSCEIDHIVAWNGSNTVETNLHALCSPELPPIRRTSRSWRLGESFVFVGR